MSHTHLFKGLDNIYKKKKSNKDFVIGEPCIYEDHYTDEFAWRCNETGACRLCIEEFKTNTTIRLDLGRVREKHHKRTARFWSYVDALDWDSCWKFEQPSKSGPNRYFWIRPELVNRYTHHIHRVLTWLAWGDFGNCGTVSLCGERNCCNPLHQLPVGFGDIDTTAISKDYLLEQLAIMREQAESYNVYQSNYQKGIKNSELIIPTLLNVNLCVSGLYCDNSELTFLTPFQQAIKDTKKQIEIGVHTTQKG